MSSMERGTGIKPVSLAWKAKATINIPTPLKLVDWSADMPEINRWTAHDLDSLVLDEAFCVRQLDLAFGEMAA